MPSHGLLKLVAAVAARQRDRPGAAAVPTALVRAL